MLKLSSPAVSVKSKRKIRKICDPWEPESIIGYLWSLDITLIGSEEDKPSCFVCTPPKQMGIKDYPEFSVYDVVNDGPHSNWLAVAHGETCRYQCSKSISRKGAPPPTCPNKHSIYDKAYIDTYMNCNKMTSDFKNVLADLALSNHEWDYKALNKLMKFKGKSVCHDLVKDAVLDRVNAVGKNIYVAPDCEKVYIIKSKIYKKIKNSKKYEKEPILLMFGKIHADAKRFTSVSRQFYECKTDDFAFLGMYQDNKSGREELVTYLEKDTDLEIVVVCSKDNEAVKFAYNLKKRMAEVQVFNIDGYVSRKDNTTGVERKYWSLISGVAAIVDDMAYRKMTFSEMQARLFFQSRFRRMDVSEDLYDRLRDVFGHVFDTVSKEPKENMVNCMTSQIGQAKYWYRDAPDNPQCVPGDTWNKHLLNWAEWKTFPEQEKAAFDVRPTVIPSFVSPQILTWEYYNDNFFCDYVDDLYGDDES